MIDKEKNNQETGQSEIIQITPTESPSENFLVTEHLQRMPNIFSRGLVYLIILALLTALIYSLASRIDMVVECRSVARPLSHKIKIFSDRNGYIEKIFISEGQAVEKNAPLFLIRSKESLAYRAKVEELRHSIPLKKEYYSTKIFSVRDELNQLESNHSNSMRVKKLRLEQNNLSIKSVEFDLVYWQKEIESLLKEYESMKKLLKKGLISIKEHNYTKSRLEKARTEVKKLISQKNITSKENTILEEEIEKERSNYKSRNMILEKEIKNLELEKRTTLNAMQNELEMNEKMLSLQDGSSSHQDDDNEKEKMVKAENAGTVSELYFRNTGEYVRESDLLCTVLPAGSPLYMDITVVNKDIGFIEEDMEIKYKFDAFPYADYGVLLGKVSAISPSALEDSKLGFIYHVRGTLDKTYFEIKGKNYPVKAGMTANAELVTEKKSIFSMLFKKLKGEK